MQISEDLQKVLDTALAMEQVVSVEVKEPPANVLSQVGEGQYVYLDYIVKDVDDKEIPLAFIVPVGLIGPDSYKHLPLEDLLNCGCTHVEDGIGHICGESVYSNIGKTTYLVREPDAVLVPIQEQQPQIIVFANTEQQQLLDRLSALDKVKIVRYEYILDDNLREESGEGAVIVAAAIDLDKNKTIDHWVNFVATKTVWDNELGHDWAVENLKNLIELNNA